MEFCGTAKVHTQSNPGQVARVTQELLEMVPVAKSSSQTIQSCRANMYHNTWKAIYYFKSIPSRETS